MDIKEENQLYVNNLEKNRKSFSFKAARFLNRIFFSKPKYRFLKEEFPDEPIMFLSNHVGKKVPTRVELYYPRDFRMWGAHEMGEGLKAVHKYLRITFYHEKKHFPMWFSNIIGTLFAPFANAFYKGMRIIPTYQDYRFMSTIKWTTREYNAGRDIVIYPEDSSQGYKEELTKLYSGFAYFLEIMYRKGKDIPIYVAYYQKKTHTFVIDRKVMYSELKEKYNDYDSIAEAIRVRMNELKNL